MGQDYGDFPQIDKQNLQNDLEILHQGLDKFHSGMYWYTPKDSVDQAFQEAKTKINKDLNIHEFYKLVAPLVALAREGHTGIKLPQATQEQRRLDGAFLPLTVLFEGDKLVCLRNLSDQNHNIEGVEIETINGETPIQIINKIGSFLMVDGYNKTARNYYLEGFDFARYYYYYYGNIKSFNIKFKTMDREMYLKPLSIDFLNSNQKKRYPKLENSTVLKPLLEYKIIEGHTAYLGVHSFNNDRIKERYPRMGLEHFLKVSFKDIEANKIKTLIIDVSKNGGGNEGNESLLYSYLGDNYQKYQKVRAKTQKAILDNGVDKPVTLKLFGFTERLFQYKTMEDGSMERRKNEGFGLMAFKKEPKNKFDGKTYVIIGPGTYSGGSEFANMVYTNDLATFVGQETGGGYYGNTSGYSKDLVLPHSKIVVSIPALQFKMNVKPSFPLGSGLKPDYTIIPTYEQRLNQAQPAVDFILQLKAK